MRERLDDHAKCGGKGLEETRISGGKKNEMAVAWVAVISSSMAKDDSVIIHAETPIQKGKSSNGFWCYRRGLCQ